MERALACWPGPQLLRRTGAPTRESSHQVSGRPSLAERMCKIKATPSCGSVSVLLDMPKDNRRGPSLQRWPLSLVQASATKCCQEGKSRGTFFFGGGGNQGPIFIQFMRVGRVAGASMKRSGRNRTQTDVGIQCPVVTGVQRPDFLC